MWRLLVLTVHGWWLRMENLLARFDRLIRPAPTAPEPTESPRAPVVLSVVNKDPDMDASYERDEEPVVADDPRRPRDDGMFRLRRFWRRVWLRTTLAFATLAAAVAGFFAGHASDENEESTVTTGVRLAVHDDEPEFTATARDDRRRGNPAWTLAAITGTIGVILMFLMFWFQNTSVPAAIRSTPAVGALDASDPFGLEPELGRPAPIEVPAEPEPFFPLEPEPQPEPEFPAMPNEQAAIEDDLPPLPPLDFNLPPSPPIPRPDLELQLTRVAPPAPEPPELPEQFLVESDEESANIETPPEFRELIGFGDDLPRAPMNPLGALRALEDEWNRALPGMPLAPEPPSLYRDRLTPDEVARLEAEVKSPVERPADASAATDLQLSIEKHVPAETVAHEAFEYEIVVRNSGDDVLRQVTVDEQIPAGHAVTDVVPAGLLTDQSLQWRLRDLQPGDEERLRVRLLAGGEGEFRSITQVHGTSAVAATTTVEGVRLRLEVIAPPKVAQHEPCVFRFKITNIGEVDASGVVLRHDLPGELSYHIGRQVDYAVGNLAAGQSHEARLTARAEEIAAVASTSELVVGDDVVETASTSVEITPPLPRRPAPRIGSSPFDCLCVPYIR